ncbi:hypothetical protein J2Z28_005339 [Paenibacillus xylanexedens]|uniref:Uncharacterized protein n=2 Tax=Paenibacillus xylanexedens TaxID=528191 RepID=A0ABS4S0J5_PAEXY|nr:hypothetical protein [Paenibacillus xylanexedens]
MSEKRMRKIPAIISFLLALVIMLSIFPMLADANFSNGYPDKDIEVTPSGLAKGKQTIKVKVTGTATPRPKTVWTQGDYDIWQATRNEGDRVETQTFSSGDNALPMEKAVKDKINTTNYVPASLQDEAGNRFQKVFVKSVGIDDISYVDVATYTPVGAKPDFEKGKLFAIIETKTGYPNKVTEKRQYGIRQDGDKKFQADYETPLKIDYSGYVNETKEIRVREDMQLQVDDVKSLVAEIRTKAYNQEEFGNWVNVSKRAEQIEWSSNQKEVVYVEKLTGQIVAKTSERQSSRQNGKIPKMDRITFMKM